MMIPVEVRRNVRLLVEGSGSQLTPRDDVGPLTRDEERRLEIVAEMRSLMPMGWDVVAMQQAARETRTYQAEWRNERRRAVSGPERDALLQTERDLDRQRRARMSPEAREHHLETRRRAKAKFRGDPDKRGRERKAERERQRDKRAAWSDEERATYNAKKREQRRRRQHAAE